MNRLLILAALAALFVTTGCKSIEVERRPSKLATITDTNGTVTVVKDKVGNPIVLDGGWSVDYFQHWNWQKFDSFSAAAGAGVTLQINNYQSGADSNLVALVHTSLDGLTKLVATAADAYCKVAGGGAQADTAVKVAGKIAKYFTDKGGDVSKAKVTTDATAKTVTVTDGTTAIQCDAAGNCTDCAPPAQ